MPFVKIDCGIINSTIWLDRPAREIFLTSLLMAEPREITEPKPQISVVSLDNTGWVVPPGWYGFVPASGVGIIDRAKVPVDEGRQALVRLGEPEMESRSQDFEGRRLVRIDGGFLVLNYMKYRERDYTSAARQRRFRQRHKRNDVTSQDNTGTSRNITHAEAEYRVDTEDLGKKQDLGRERDDLASLRSDQSLRDKNRTLNGYTKPKGKTKNDKAVYLIAKQVVQDKPGEAFSELSAEAKDRAARAGIYYDAEVVTKALESALAVKTRASGRG